MGEDGNNGAGQDGQSDKGAGEGQGAGQGGQGNGQGAGQGDNQGAGQGGDKQNQQAENMSIKELETALGMSLVDAKAILDANKKQKSAPKGEQLTGADLKLAKMEALMLRGVPSTQIPVLLQHLNIVGSNLAEINASLDALVAAKLLPLEQPGNQGTGQGNGAAQGGGNAQGAGNQGLQNGGQQQGKTIWTANKVRELRLSGSLTEQMLADIKLAESEGRVKE